MRVRYYRKLRSMTQSQLAERVGVTQAYICSLENGKRTNPSLQLLLKIARALDVTVEELAGGMSEAV